MIQTERPAEMPRIPPGARIRYDYGKWDFKYPHCRGGIMHDPNWATYEWAYTVTGVTVDPREFAGHIYPWPHPWGLPPWSTPVRFDGYTGVTYVRTSCLDLIGWAEKSEAKSQMELFS